MIAYLLGGAAVIGGLYLLWKKNQAPTPHAAPQAPSGPTPTVLESSGITPVEVQAALDLLGYKVPQDGVYGQQTIEAVKQFQASKGLVVDGIVGPHTRMAMEQELKDRGLWTDPNY